MSAWIDLVWVACREHTFATDDPGSLSSMNTLKRGAALYLNGWRVNWSAPHTRHSSDVPATLNLSFSVELSYD